MKNEEESSPLLRRAHGNLQLKDLDVMYTVIKVPTIQELMRTHLYKERLPLRKQQLLVGPRE